jgi:hypothetical protein
VTAGVAPTTAPARPRDPVRGWELATYAVLLALAAAAWLVWSYAF